MWWRRFDVVGYLLGRNSPSSASRVVEHSTSFEPLIDLLKFDGCYMDWTLLGEGEFNILKYDVHVFEHGDERTKSTITATVCTSPKANAIEALIDMNVNKH